MDCPVAFFKGRLELAYVTLTHWTTTTLNDDLVAAANEKFVPMIMQVGASSVQVMRTGELSICVITQYKDAETAIAAQERIAHIRSQAANEFPMTIDSVHAGDVIGGSQV
jgi:hypothetical protein